MAIRIAFFLNIKIRKMSVKEGMQLINTLTVQFIVGTICILILASRLERLFQVDENRNSGEAPKKYRQRFGRIAKNGTSLFLSEK